MMANPGWSHRESPFHPGELAIQARLGIQERMDKQGRRIIREYLIEQHQKFFAQLSYIVVGTVDEFGNLWASILMGEPGFLSAPEDNIFQVTSQILPGDPLAFTLKEGVDIGLLGIELSNRRRNRINGVVASKNDDSFEVLVEQSFGNCPQYIQARTFEKVTSDESIEIAEIKTFDNWERNLIANADTFFIATAYQDESAGIAGGVDVSHRGGRSGFIRIDGEKTLTIPDFSGNNHFNTIGNIEVNPPTGLLFIDFARGDVLYLTGFAEIIWESEEIDSFAGAEQLIRFHLKRGYRVKASLPLRWSNPEFSPFLEHTGSW